MVDFQVNYIAGKRLRWAETLYRFEDRHFMFKYLPSAAFLYLPLSCLPLQAAKLIWYFLIIACSGGIIFISYRLLPDGDKPKYLMILPLLITARFFLREIALGQINTVVTVTLLIMTLYLASEAKGAADKRGLYAGLFWGAGVAMKPYALIFLPYLIIKKKWTPLAAGFGCIAAALIAPAVFYGFQGNFTVLKEWHSTLSRSTPPLLSTLDNISILASFTKWTDDPDFSLICSAALISLMSILVLILILKGRELQRPEVLECGLCLTVIPLVSPLGWDYTLLSSTLGIMLLIRYFTVFAKFWRIFLVVNFAVIALAFYDLLGKELYTLFMKWSVTTVNFLVLSGYLAYLRIKKIC